MTVRDKKARLFTVPIIMDPDVETAYLEAQYELDQTAERLLKTAGDRIRAARAAAQPGNEEAATQAIVDADEKILTQLRDKRETAKQTMDDATEYFKFRALGRKHYKDLIKAHPPTAEDVKAWEEAEREGKCPWNHDGLARELVRRACVSPLLDEADITEIFDGREWNQTEVDMLWIGASSVQVQGPR